jgi:hypothetical protein
MAIRFNPLTGNFDFTGSGGGGGGSAFFAGEVATYADLPLDGTAALNSRWLVRSNSGTWPFSTYKQAGIYIRIGTVGSDRDDDYTLTDTSFHDVMSDDAFLIFDNTDPTKAAKFDVGANVPTTSTVTLTVPASSGTIALTSLVGAAAELVIACSDETTNLTTGTAKVTFRMPYAMTLSSVRASVNTAPTGSTLIVDINEGGSTILSTKLSIDASELTSTTAATAAVISDTALADDASITIDIDQIGSTIAGKGLKVVLKGTRA